MKAKLFQAKLFHASNAPDQGYKDGVYLLITDGNTHEEAYNAAAEIVKDCFLPLLTIALTEHWDSERTLTQVEGCPQWAFQYLKGDRKLPARSTNETK